MTQQHTPTPWVNQEGMSVGSKPLEICTSDCRALIALVLDRPDISHQSEANAAFIVRACNSHEALVEALKQALELIEPSAFPKLIHTEGDTIRKALAALAKAEVKG